MRRVLECRRFASRSFLAPSLAFAVLVLSIGPTSATAQTFAEQLNPTGDPIGGYIGYSSIVTEQQADYVVRTRSELLQALSTATSGQIIFIPSDVTIDMGTDFMVRIPSGVTLASDRGRLLNDGSYSSGGLIISDHIYSDGTATVFRSGGSGIRITGLRARGPYPWAGDHHYETYGYAGFVRIDHSGAEVDNCELWAWNKWAVWAVIQRDVHVHHNYIHHTRRDGYGYGVWFGGSGSETGATGIAEANLLEANRHHIASSGHPNSWIIRHNVVLPRGSLQQQIDRHGYIGDTGGINSLLHHNLFIENGNHFDLSSPLAGYGGEVRINNNWFRNSDMCAAGGVGISYNACTVSAPDIFIYDNHMGGSGTNLPTPVITASTTNGTAPLTVNFSAAGSSDPDGYALTWARWHFGNGDAYGDEQRITDMSSTVSYTFDQPGRYVVELIVVNSLGVPGIARRAITVDPPSGGYVLSAWVHDTYDGSRTGYYRKQILANGQVLWEDDVAGREGWQHVVVNLPSGLSAGSSVRIAMRVYVARGVSNPSSEIIEMRAFFDDVHVFGGNITNGGFEGSTGWRFASQGTIQNGISQRDARSGEFSARIGYSYNRTSSTGTYGEYYQTITLSEGTPTQSTQQDVNLVPGWNLISTHVSPADPSMESVLAPISNVLVIAKSLDGSVYSPEFGINTIGNWQQGEAYMVYVDAGAVLRFTGDLIPASTAIGLGEGWNLTAYLPIVSKSTTESLASIQSDLLLAKDGQGSVYYPELSVDNINTLVPGAGYHLYLRQAAQLVYPQ